MRTATLTAALALVALGCTGPNPGYCPDVPKTHRCPVDGGAKDVAEAVDRQDAKDTGDVRETGDAGDAIVDAMKEAPPICTDDTGCPADGGKLACFAGEAGPMCVECTDSTKHCKDTKKPACDTTVHQCVECVGTGTECTFDATKPACNVMTKKCVECVDSSKCAPAKPVCDTMAKKCVECLDNTKCSATKPICDTVPQTCRACRADSECTGIGPGICVDWDGHCATNAEVVTLQGGTCVPAGMLYCTGATAVAALSPASPVLVVHGPAAVGMLAPPSGAPEKVLIVGRLGATVSAGAGDAAGIDVPAAHKVWVRDLTVSGGTVGIVAEAGSELHVTRCIVSNNGKGGIKTIDASFDITNTVVAGNMAGLDIGGVAFGGVRLGDVPGGGTARFENNTVVDNKLIGISCKTSRDVSTSIVHGNLGGDSVNCSGTVCCGAADPNPMLDASFHLQATSPCIDKLTASAMSPTTDIQSQARPTAMGKLDCGADEYLP